MYLPFLSTLQRSATCMISASLCVMKRMLLPSAARFCMIVISSWISCGVNTAVGSSKIRISMQVRRGEIVCIAGIDGNGQTEFVYGLSGLEPLKSGTIVMNGQDITHMTIRQRLTSGMSHIPEDRHKHGLVLDYSLEDNIVLQRYFEPRFTSKPAM